MTFLKTRQISFATCPAIELRLQLLSRPRLRVSHITHQHLLWCWWLFPSWSVLIPWPSRLDSPSLTQSDVFEEINLDQYVKIKPSTIFLLRIYWILSYIGLTIGWMVTAWAIPVLCGSYNHSPNQATAKCAFLFFLLLLFYFYY